MRHSLESSNRRSDNIDTPRDPEGVYRDLDQNAQNEQIPTFEEHMQSVQRLGELFDELPADGKEDLLADNPAEQHAQKVEAVRAAVQAVFCQNE